MDDIWFAAGKTLELSPISTSTQNNNVNTNTNTNTKSNLIDHEHKESEYEYKYNEEQAADEQDEKECKYYHITVNNNEEIKKEVIVSNIIKDLINVSGSFDDNDKLPKCCNMLTTDYTTIRSSVGSETDIIDNGDNTYSTSNLNSNEPSMSYIIDDANTPLPPNEPITTNNTSALYEFLFDKVDTDTDDDDCM